MKTLKTFENGEAENVEILHDFEFDFDDYPMLRKEYQNGTLDELFYYRHIKNFETSRAELADESKLILDFLENESFNCLENENGKTYLCHTNEFAREFYQKSLECLKCAENIKNESTVESLKQAGKENPENARFYLSREFLETNLAEFKFFKKLAQKYAYLALESNLLQRRIVNESLSQINKITHILPAQS